jgi:GntR family transcriptional regulator, histidine utilization repressor
MGWRPAPRLSWCGGSGEFMTKTSAPSLHHRIRADIEGRILTGEWGPGTRLPYEHELMARYGCSRMTVNKVMTSLAESGLIERRRRAGSFVRRPVALAAVLRITDIKAEIEARGEDHVYELLERAERAASVEDAARLECPLGTRVLWLRCVHRADGLPFAHEDRLINLAELLDAGTIDFAAEPPGPWLIAHAPWTEAEHRIRATAASIQVASALDLAPGTACLVIRRKTLRAGQTITAVTLTYPGDQHELVARFTP